MAEAGGPGTSCRCGCDHGVAGQASPPPTSVCARCGGAVEINGLDEGRSGELSIDSKEGPTHTTSFSRSSRHDTYEDDDDDGGAPDGPWSVDAVEPPGWTCKVIVLMCGIATFARTECILLQTVLFAECESLRASI